MKQGSGAGSGDVDPEAPTVMKSSGPPPAAVDPATSETERASPPGQPLPRARSEGQDELVGHRIGQYRIRRKLGQGAMGMVYLARDETLLRDIALKILPENLARDDDFVKRFYQEARTAARLNHTHIVSVHTVGSHEKFHYIAMEHVRGETLDAHIKWKGKLDVREAFEISRQVADALQAAHDMQILHRDIKPANIMLDRQGRAKVMDFGIAKVMNDQTSLTLTGAMIGTPKYMSPEQCQAMTIDGRSDIFSLGIVMYEMLTGKAPFDDESQLGVMMKVIDFEPDRLTELEQRLPREAARIVHKALKKKPDERYLRAQNLVEDITLFLADYDSGRSRTASPLTRVLDRTGDTLRRIPKGVAALGLAVVLLAAALGVALTRGDKPADGGTAVAGAETGTGEGVPGVDTTKAQPFEPAPAVTLPEIQFASAPPEGATLSERELHLTWNVSGLADHFLVGLNTEEPGERTNAPSCVVNFSRPGEQIVRVIPVTDDGTRGPVLRRRFVYQPNRRPTLIGSATGDTLPYGEPFGVNFMVTDPDGDPTRVQIRVDGGPWGDYDGTVTSLPRLPVGRHAVEARALDDKGEISEVWNHWVTVEPAKDAVETAADLFSGTGGRVDEGEAKKRMLAESERGQPLARMWVAWFHFWGRCGFPRDIDFARRAGADAFEEVSTLAGRGNAQAAFLLGAAYDRGIGTEESYELAARWIARAAEAQYPPAMGYLGFMCIEGRAVRRDYDQGIRWLRSGAEAGDVNAMYNLANMYAQGIGVERDETQAAVWYGRGAERGSARNMVRLGELLEAGRGIEVDFEGAVELYREAARLGDPDARSALRRLNLE